MIASTTCQDDCQVEYHKLVKRCIPAPVAVFGLLFLPALLSAFLASSSQAQIKGAPASVTSPGFGGRAINGTPASVTSLGRSGYAPNSGGLRAIAPNGAATNKNHKHLHPDLRYGGIYAVPVPVPYAENATDDPDNDANYQGGPTIFDRRGAGAQSYIPPTANSSAPHANQSAANPDESDPAQEPTTLIFKDGHQVEVENYAIVGRTLFDMTPGHPRKVAIADLDLNATEKQNDEHGVRFQLPPGTQAN
jgi:hypothetical protein